MKGRNRRTARVAMALFMTLAMIFPMTANATVAENDVARIGDEGYETLQAAFNAVPDGTTTTVTLIDNIQMSTADIAELAAGKSIVLNMNGKSITVDDSFVGRPIVNRGEMTIEGNGTIDSSMSTAKGYGAVDNYGVMTIENGHFSGDVDANGASVRNRATGTLTINDGIFDGATTALYNEGKATVYNGEFIGRSCSSCNPGAWGYTIRSYQDSNSPEIKPELIFYDGLVEGVQGAFSTSAGTSTIYDGTFRTVPCKIHSDGSTAFYAFYVAGESGEVVTHVYGGEFTSFSKTAAYIGNNNDGGMKKDALVYIHDGVFTAQDGINAVTVSEPIGGAKISGGSFSSDVSELLSEDGDYAQLVKKDGTYLVIEDDEKIAAESGAVYKTIIDGKTFYYEEKPASLPDDEVSELYTIAFDSKGGSAVDPQVITEGEKATEPNVPVREGYKFEGWYIEETYETAWDFDNIPESSMTLYAKWSEIPKEPASGESDNTSGSTSASPDKSVATGDDTNLTLMFVIMGLAAAAAAGTVVYGRRKRSS